MQKILAEISNDRIRNYHSPQHEPDKKSKLNTNEVRRVWLLLSHNSYARFNLSPIFASNQAATRGGARGELGAIAPVGAC